MDLKYFREMAEASPALAPGVPAPFVFRLLGPWLAGLLPLAGPAAFYFSTAVYSFALAAVLSHLYRPSWAGSHAAALAVVLLLLNKHLFGIHVWDFFQVKDSLSIFLVAGCFLSMHSGRWVLFAFLMALGSAVIACAILSFMHHSMARYPCRRGS